MFPVAELHVDLRIWFIFFWSVLSENDFGHSCMAVHVHFGAQAVACFDMLECWLSSSKVWNFWNSLLNCLSKSVCCPLVVSMLVDVLRPLCSLTQCGVIAFSLTLGPPFEQAMAAPIGGGMTPDEQRQFVADRMDSDLQFILSDCGVSLDGMVAVSRRFGTLKKFNAIGDSRADVRAACLHDFAITQDTPDDRAEVAAIVSAWESAQEYVSKELELRAEAKVTGQPRNLQTHERQAMLRAVEGVYGSLNECDTPSNDYLSVKAEEVECNEPNAAPLDEIMSKKESSTSQITSSVDASGHLKILRTKSKGKMPTTTEEYRRVMRVEGYAWLCMAARYKAKPWLSGITMDTFTKFVDFILGERVLNIQVAGAGSDGQVRVKPDWSIVLAFEHKLRKEAFKLVLSEGFTLSDAMKAVTKDAELKEAFFTTPIALRAALPPDTPPQNKWQRPNSKGVGGLTKGGSKSFQKQHQAI